MHFLSGLEPAARITVATLFNSLWEAAILAAIVALVLRVLPNVNATTRYAAWCVALVASLLLPLATALPQIAVQQPAVQHAAPVLPHASSEQRAAKVQAGVQRTTPVTSTRTVTSTAAPSSSVNFRLPERLHFSLPQYVALAIFGAWAIAALLFLVRLAVNLWRLERLKVDALPLPVEYRERLERWSTADKGEREVRLCICESIEVPVAVGLFDSMILIPKHLLDTLTQNEVDQIILHELAHLRRADDWTNGLQRFIQALFFFNPAVLYIAQQLDLEREVACDDWVVVQTKEVRPYATCLTKMAEATAWPHRPLAAPGVFVTRRGLSVRVERLLRAGRNIRTRVSFGPTGAIVAALIVLFFVLQNVAPSFAFTLGGVRTQSAAAQAPRKKIPAAAKEPAPSASASSSAKHAQTLVIPGVHVHMKGYDVHVPSVDVDTPAQRVRMPVGVPKTSASLPPNFAQKIAGATQTVTKAVNESVSSSVAAAFGGKGKFNCVGCDYSGQNLAGHSFRKQQLSGADFSNANLRNADFSNTVLVGADFSGADLRGANFSNSKLTGCDFSRARIDGINFAGVTMVGCDVDARSLPPQQAAAVLRGCRTGCDFSYANLSGQDLSNLTLTGIDMKHADLHGANLSNVRFQGVDFTGARLDGARFDGAEFTGCDFSGVDMHDVDLGRARITGSKMGGSDN
jgi:uncharacterized protein YjbI with pentapeptide repeats/beta-lactamase regulating signal transducer with metallopeptidase domain